MEAWNFSSKPIKLYGNCKRLCVDCCRRTPETPETLDYHTEYEWVAYWLWFFCGYLSPMRKCRMCFQPFSISYHSLVSTFSSARDMEIYFDIFTAKSVIFSQIRSISVCRWKFNREKQTRSYTQSVIFVFVSGCRRCIASFTFNASPFCLFLYSSRPDVMCGDPHIYMHGRYIEYIFVVCALRTIQM